MEINFEEICNNHKNCSDCPLLIKQIRMSDPDYDYHNINICYKKEYNTIEKIRQFLADYNSNNNKNKND